MIEHMTDPSKQVVRIQHPIGQVLRSRCHLYFFSFPPRTRLCPLTRGGTARLLGLGPFSLQLEKGSSRGPAARLSPARALWGRGAPGTFLFSNAFPIPIFQDRKKASLSLGSKTPLSLCWHFTPGSSPCQAPFSPARGPGGENSPLTGTLPSGTMNTYQQNVNRKGRTHGTK